MKLKSFLRRFGAIALTGAIMLGSAVCASAADTQKMTGFNHDATTGTLTINDDGTYDVYQLYTATAGNNTYTYTANDKYADMLGGVTANDLSGYDANAVQNFLNTMMGKFDNKVAADYTITGKSASSLPIGYYMVVQKSDEATPGTVTSPILTAIPSTDNNAWVYDVTVKPKNSKTDLTKKIIEDGNLVDTSNSKIGSDIDYQITSTVPAYGADIDKSKVTYAITDNPSAALTVKMDTITVKMGETILKANEYYTVSSNKDGGFTVKFDYSKLTAGATVTVNFTATLNEKAIVNKNAGLTVPDYTNVLDENYNGQGNPNGATLEYTNNYYTGTTSKIRDIVTSFTTLVGIEKVDKDNADTKLVATFGLYSDKDCKNKIEELTTNEKTGLTASSTLKPGTYYLKEIAAPEGYAESDVVYTVVISATKNAAGEYDGTFVITADGNELNNPLTIGSYDNVQTLRITNTKGVILPGTGGMGNKLFVLIGVGLMGAAAGAFLLRRKFKNQ